MLGVTIRTLYRLVDDGALTAYRFGRVIRIKRSDLTTFIESCRIEPGTASRGVVGNRCVIPGGVR